MLEETREAPDVVEKITSHDLELIQKEIGQLIEKQGSISAVLNAAINLPLYDVKYLGSISIPAARTIRDHTRKHYSERLFMAASLEWLNAAPPLKTLDDLPNIQKTCSLDHLSEKVFLNGLRNSLTSIFQQNDKVRNWVLRRVALLDYKIEKHSRTHSMAYSDLRTNLDIEQRKYHYITPLIAFNRHAAPAQAKRLEEQLESHINTVLNAAGQAVLSAFGKDIEVEDNCVPKVNIMFPIQVRSENEVNALLFHDQITCSRMEELKINDQNARHMWGNSAAHFGNILLLAFQSYSSSPNSGDIDLPDCACPDDCICHVDGGKLINNLGKKVGFWLPFDKNIPGAPDAFCNKHGGVVIRSDIQPPNSSDSLHKKLWYAYVNNNSKEPAFISIPCIVPDPEDKMPNDKHAIAVLNIDITPTDESIIYRGYHQQWLEDARDMAKDFIIMAYHSYMLLSTINPEKYKLRVYSKIDIWDSYFNLPYKQSKPTSH